MIRVSGPLAREIALGVAGLVPPPRSAVHRRFRNADGELIDDGIVLFFPAPRSFTGEDVLELQGHGGPVVLDLLLRRCLELGARLARAGEFSERAFLNDKLDLAQAEAIADLIESGSEQAARAALRSLVGDFSRRVHNLVEGVVQLRMYVEAAIDFPEEEVDFLADDTLRQRLAALRQELLDLLSAAKQGYVLREGLHLVIAGRPNAGKSSLLNALAGRDSAIVTEIPGTTRDVLREHIQIDGLPVHVIDTAGLRDTDDRVEQLGVSRAWEEIARADRVLLIVDDTIGVTDEDQAILARLPTATARTIVLNKIDLSGRPAGLHEGRYGTEVALSAANGFGVEGLRAHLKDLVGYGEGQGEFLARRRHLEALDRALRHLAGATTQLHDFAAGELAAEELRQAQQALGEITGEFTSDDLLGRIFSTFCIGK